MLASGLLINSHETLENSFFKKVKMPNLMTTFDLYKYELASCLKFSSFIPNFSVLPLHSGILAPFSYYSIHPNSM